MESLQGRKILVVEDEYLIAMTLSDILEDAGVVVAGPIGRLEEALDYVNSEGSALDGAVLDVMLHGQTSYPIADSLLASGVKFVFVTGYNERALDVAYRNYPRCQKPFEPETILSTLTAAIVRDRPQN
jgi:DNA-binding response OmpR family regulator